MEAPHGTSTLRLVSSHIPPAILHLRIRAEEFSAREILEAFEPRNSRAARSSRRLAEIHAPIQHTIESTRIPFMTAYVLHHRALSQFLPISRGSRMTCKFPICDFGTLHRARGHH